MKWIPACVALLACPMLSAHAADRQVNSPQAGARTHAQNFKDMVLASCLAKAYRHAPGAATDAGSSASALRDWTSRPNDTVTAPPRVGRRRAAGWP